MKAEQERGRLYRVKSTTQAKATEAGHTQPRTVGEAAGWGSVWPGLSQPTTCEGIVSVDFDSCNMWRRAQCVLQGTRWDLTRGELYIC